MKLSCSSKECQFSQIKYNYSFNILSLYLDLSTNNQTKRYILLRIGPFLNKTRRYSQLRRPTSSSCGGLWPLAGGFLAGRVKKRF